MVSSYDVSIDTILDPRYGHIIFEYSTWGKNEDGTGFYIEKIPLNSHYCSQEELGLSEDKSKSKFLPIKDEFKQSLTFFQSKHETKNRLRAVSLIV